MKRRTKILSALTASVMLVSAMCFGYAQWSSEIDLNGSVSASGKWDVAVTDASVNLSSSGAVFSQASGTKENVTYATEAYAVILGEGSDTNYYLLLDTANGVQKDVDLSDYTASGRGYYGPSYTKYFTGDKLSKSEFYDYYVNADIAGKTGNRLVSKDGNDLEAYVGKVIGYAAASGNVTTGDLTVTADAETTYTANAVSYAGVEFSIPGAWANYSVTITNNGTVNANVNDYEFVTSALDEDIFTVDTPELGNDVLKPGESCTFNFVVQVDTTVSELDVDAANFTVTLNYVQDTVEAAPSASHSH